MLFLTVDEGAIVDRFLRLRECYRTFEDGKDEGQEGRKRRCGGIH